MSAGELESLFPSLREDGYAITSPEDARYNCAAWAVGETRRKWWPAPDYYWPDWLIEDSVEGFVRLFTGRGYEPCTDAGFDPAFDRIAIYEHSGLPSHIARQVAQNLWTSKIGDLEDITHSLGGLEGREYGSVAVILRRPRVAGPDPGS